mgnify:FL=1
MKRVLPLLVVCLLSSVTTSSAMSLSFYNDHDFTRIDKLDRKVMKKGNPFSRLKPVRFDLDKHPLFSELIKEPKHFSKFPALPGVRGKKEGGKHSLAYLGRNYHPRITDFNPPAGGSSSGTAPVPEPSSMLLMSVGLSFFAYTKRKKAVLAKG